jgi:hypothetical protein
MLFSSITKVNPMSNSKMHHRPEISRVREVGCLVVSSIRQDAVAVIPAKSEIEFPAQKKKKKKLPAFAGASRSVYPSHVTHCSLSPWTLACDSATRASEKVFGRVALTVNKWSRPIDLYLKYRHYIQA